MVDCPLCGAWLDTGDDMRAHIATSHLKPLHPGNDWYRCWCGYHLTTRFSLLERSRYALERLANHFPNNAEIVQHYLAYAFGEQPMEEIPF